MPAYEYICRDCNEKLEVVQRFSEPPILRCNNCGGELRKKIFAPIIHFNGTGFYVNDSKSELREDKNKNAQ